MIINITKLSKFLNGVFSIFEWKRERNLLFIFVIASLSLWSILLGLYFIKKHECKKIDAEITDILSSLKRKQLVNMSEEKTYFAKGKSYTIPLSEKDNFLSDFPDAQEAQKFVVKGKSYTIPLSEKDNFLSDFPNAKPLYDEVKELLDAIDSHPFGKGAYTYESLSNDLSDKDKAKELFDVLESIPEFKGTYKNPDELMSLKKRQITPSYDEFKPKLRSDSEFQAKTYQNLKSAYGDDYTLSYITYSRKLYDFLDKNVEDFSYRGKPLEFDSVLASDKTYSDKLYDFLDKNVEDFSYRGDKEKFYKKIGLKKASLTEKDKVSELYGLISDKGYFKDEKEFRDFTSNSKNIDEVYDLVKDDGYFKDKNEFSGYFGESLKKGQDFTPTSEIAPLLPQGVVYKKKNELRVIESKITELKKLNTTIAIIHGIVFSVFFPLRWFWIYFISFIKSISRNKIKKAIYYLVGVIVIIAFLNPSLSDFKEFIPSKDHPCHGIESRSQNWLLFSVYVFKCDGIEEEEIYGTYKFNISEYTYLGIFKNFVLLKKDISYSSTEKRKRHYR